MLLWKGSNLNLEKAIEICRADEVTKKQLQLMLQEKESAKTNKKKKFYQKKVDRDAKKRYWQIPLDENSSKLTTINTPFGRYKLLILAFGIHSAQQVFHRIINGSFIDIVGVETDVNDFLIWGKEYRRS